MDSWHFIHMILIKLCRPYSSRWKWMWLSYYRYWRWSIFLKKSLEAKINSLGCLRLWVPETKHLFLYSLIIKTLGTSTVILPTFVKYHQTCHSVFVWKNIQQVIIPWLPIFYLQKKSFYADFVQHIHFSEANKYMTFYQ